MNLLPIAWQIRFLIFLQSDREQSPLHKHEMFPTSLEICALLAALGIRGGPGALGSLCVGCGCGGPGR